VRRRRPPGFNLRLAETVREVTADYVSFLRGPRGEEPEDAKAFGARHAAAKAALAHLEALIKLAAESDEAAAERLGGCERLLRETRREIGEELDDDHDGGAR
jgi:hypothetical protein